MNAPGTVEVHGHARGVRVLGTGPTALLLVHGIGSAGATWDAVAPGLAEHFTVIVPDLLGHGHSAKPRADYSIGGYANGMRDLLGLLDIERVTVVGHSFGGGVAMQFAYQFPERTDRLVLVGSGGLGSQVSIALRALTLPGAAVALRLSQSVALRLSQSVALRLSQSVALRLGQLAPAPLAAAALRAARGLGLSPALAADITEALTVLAGLRDPAARSAFLHVLRHVVDWRGQVITMRDRAYLTEGLPTLVVWGEEDHVLPVEHATAAAELMPGARTVVLPGVGHFPHREAPDAFVAAVTDFVASTRPKHWDATRWRKRLRTHAQGRPL
jgi:pimeloyl-ACP methyl ester carboxylesterase